MVPVILFVILDGYISYNDRVAMRHMQVTISSVTDSHIFKFCHVTRIEILQAAVLVKSSGELQFTHGIRFCALNCHWLY